MTKLKEFKKRLMEDPEFREEYARVDEEYALVEALVPARTAAKLTHPELARRLVRPGPQSRGRRVAGPPRPLPRCAASPKRPACG